MKWGANVTHIFNTYTIFFGFLRYVDNYRAIWLYCVTVRVACALRHGVY